MCYKDHNTDSAVDNALCSIAESAVLTHLQIMMIATATMTIMITRGTVAMRAMCRIPGQEVGGVMN